MNKPKPQKPKPEPSVKPETPFSEALRRIVRVSPKEIKLPKR